MEIGCLLKIMYLVIICGGLSNLVYGINNNGQVIDFLNLGIDNI